MAVADNGGDSGHCCQFFGSALSIATGDDDAGFGVEAVGAADVGSCLTVCFGCNGAGVDDHDIGIGGWVFNGTR